MITDANKTPPPIKNKGKEYQNNVNKSNNQF
jgi:hypothetical protein